MIGSEIRPHLAKAGVVLTHPPYQILPVRRLRFDLMLIVLIFEAVLVDSHRFITARWIVYLVEEDTSAV